MNDRLQPTSLDSLRFAIEQAYGPDRPGLRRRLSALKRRRRLGQPYDRGLAALAQAVAASAALVASRREGLPCPDYPPELPVVQRREELLELIGKHQVVIVCGETGDRKSVV